MQDISFEDLLLIATGIVTLASVITSITGTPNPNTLWGKVYKGIEVLALIVHRAKEKGDESKK